MGMINSLMTYMGAGTLGAVGFDADDSVYGRGRSGPNRYMRWGSADLAQEFNPSGSNLQGFKAGPKDIRGIGMTSAQDSVAGMGLKSRALNRWLPNAMAGFQGGFTLFDTYKGYKENGMRGAKDAMVWNIAQNAAQMHFSYKAAGTAGVRVIGGAARFGLNIGSTIGATIGQSIAGTPGAFAGAFVGAGLQTAAMTPQGMAVLGIGAAAIAGPAIAAGAYYGVYQIAKAGVRRTRSQQRIDTSGDTSAFMTQNAMTMRGRAVAMIHKSHQNSRSALGQEANFMHSSRNYSGYYK